MILFDLNGCVHKHVYLEVYKFEFFMLLLFDISVRGLMKRAYIYVVYEDSQF